MKARDIGQVHYLNIESILDHAQVKLNFGYNDRKEVEPFDILVYTTQYAGKAIGFTKKYFILKNLKFSHGGSNSSIFSIRNLDDNLIEIDKHPNSEQELRNFKLDLIIE